MNTEWLDFFSTVRDLAHYSEFREEILSKVSDIEKKLEDNGDIWPKIVSLSEQIALEKDNALSMAFELAIDSFKLETCGRLDKHDAEIKAIKEEIARLKVEIKKQALILGVNLKHALTPKIRPKAGGKLFRLLGNKKLG